MLKNEYDFLIYLNELQKTKRYADYDEVFRESVSEHTYKLIAMVDRFYDILKLDLDYRKCIKIAIYHDLCEIDMANDIDAYAAAQDINLKEHKKLTENTKMQAIAKQYQDANMYDIFKDYEELSSSEAKFIYALDKIEAKIRCLSIKDWPFKYADFIALHADAAVKNFPQLLPFYQVVKAEMKTRFAELGWPWKPEYDEVFQ